MSKQLLIGADVEAFVFNRESGALWEFPDSSGISPHNPALVTDHAWIYPDGAAVEMGITPARNAEEFAERITAGVVAATAYLGPNLRLSFDTVAVSLNSLPNKDTLLRANEMGCSPDFSAMLSAQSQTLHGVSMRDPMMLSNIIQRSGHRFSGGHVHIQYDQEKMPPFITALVFDSVWQRLNNTDPLINQGDSLRTRVFIGDSLGIHRPKPYGVEVRMLSSLWAASARTAHRAGQAAEITHAITESCSDDDVIGFFDQLPQDIHKHTARLIEKYCA
jgi:hypothetical protein